MKKILKYILIAIVAFSLIKIIKSDDSDNKNLNAHFFPDKQSQLVKQLVVNDIRVWMNGGESAIEDSYLFKKSLSLELIKVTANKLFEDYNKNEIKADSLYFGKELIVTGTIRSIDRSIGDTYYLSLSTKDMFSAVHANFDLIYKNTLANLNKKETYVMHCIGDGMLIGSPILKTCQPGFEFAISTANKFLATFPQILKDLIINIKDYSEDEKKVILGLSIGTNILINLPDDSPLLNIELEQNNYDPKIATKFGKLLEQAFINYPKENLVGDLKNILIKLKIDESNIDDNELIKFYNVLNGKKNTKTVKGS
jgi:hypothetical protein